MAPDLMPSTSLTGPKPLALAFFAAALNRFDFGSFFEGRGALGNGFSLGVFAECNSAIHFSAIRRLR
jgi:hypothetical protein